MRPGALFGLILVALFAVGALAADWLAPSPEAMDLAAMFQPPDASRWLGADNFGRDVLARTLHGARVSLLIGLGATLLGVAIGVPLGLIAGYFGGRTDTLISRTLELILPFPAILIAILITLAAGQSAGSVTLAIGIVLAPFFARVVRGSALSLRRQQFVEASLAVGASHAHTMLRHVLPHCLPPVIVLAALSVAFAILAEASLSFLGLGVPPPTPTWGSDLKAGIRYLELAPWIVIGPGLAVTASVLGFNLIGDGLRDAMTGDQNFLS
jgi:peptide/nickel transport system permease protein